MPDPREFLPGSTSQRPLGRADGRLVLRATGAFGEIRSLARTVLEHDGLALIVGQGWDPKAETVDRLFTALDASSPAAFAFGETAERPANADGQSGAFIHVDAEALITRPRDLGPLVVRSSEAVRLGWPDFGPPDFILDGAAAWALATALAVRGATGRFVPGATSTRTLSTVDPVESLRPQGLGWLVACALSWGSLGKPPTPLAERLWRRWTDDLTAVGFDGLTPPGRRP